MKAGRPTTYNRDTLMTAALLVAERDGYQRMSRDAIAQAANCSPTLISRYFGTMPSLRRDVIRAAIARGNHVVLAQGLAARDTHAAKAGPLLKAAALKALML